MGDFLFKSPGATATYSPPGWEQIEVLRIARKAHQITMESTLVAYSAEKTPFTQKHVLGAEIVELPYTELQKNFAPNLTSAFIVGDYAADVSGRGVSGFVTKISQKYKNKRGKFLTLDKALRNGRNKISPASVCVKAHAINEFVRNLHSKQWYCVKEHRSGHACLKQVFVEAAAADKPAEDANAKAAADAKAAEDAKAAKTAAADKSADDVKAAKAAADAKAADDDKASADTKTTDDAQAAAAAKAPDDADAKSKKRAAAVKAAAAAEAAAAKAVAAAKAAAAELARLESPPNSPPRTTTKTKASRPSPNSKCHKLVLE